MGAVQHDGKYRCRTLDVAENGNGYAAACEIGVSSGLTQRASPAMAFERGPAAQVQRSFRSTDGGQ